MIPENKKEAYSILPELSQLEFSKYYTEINLSWWFRQMTLLTSLFLTSAPLVNPLIPELSPLSTTFESSPTVVTSTNFH